MERGIDLNEQLIKNKPATFFFRIISEGMVEAGIHYGDILGYSCKLQSLKNDSKKLGAINSKASNYFQYALIFMIFGDIF